MSAASESGGSRRPLKSRDTRWAVAIASWLARTGITPNQISVASAVFALAAAVALAASGRVTAGVAGWCFLGAAAGIQLRLLCNLFDGMVAVEGGRRTKSGEIYNELPDRFADAFVFVGAGFSLPGLPWIETLGWLCALLAVITAYVRALGAVAGASQFFMGPMAKQHRMAVMTLTCVFSAGFAWTGVRWSPMPWALALVAGGCVVTLVRRLSRIVGELESR